VRQFFEIILPLMLPTAIYVAYAVLLRPRGGGGMPEVPWIWLGGAGVLLLAVSLLAVALVGGAKPTDKYLPPKIVNGQIQQGHYEPAP